MPIPSLFIGAGALTTQQNAISVIANNIANVNTTSFKSSKVNFQEQVGTTLKSASSPTLTLGGANPVEVGSGISLSSVSTAFTQGSLKNTGVATDLGVVGNGFFVVSGSSVEGGGLKSPEFTRDGHFNLDSQGNLVNAAGQKVYAATFYDTATQKIKSMSGYNVITYHTDQTIGPSAAPTMQATIGGAAPNLAVPTPTLTPFVGGSAPTFTASKLQELSIRGGLIDSATSIVPAAGNLTISRLSDGRMNFAYVQAATTYSAAVDTNLTLSDGVLSFELNQTAPAGAGKLQMRIRLEPGVSSLETIFGSVDYSTALGTSDTIVFTAAAATTQIDTVAGNITVGADDIKYMKLTNIQGLYDPVRIPSFLFDQDPLLEVEVGGFAIEADGTYSIVGISSEKQKLGRILMANFTNADGLTNKGNNNYVSSSNSGTAAISVLGGPFDKNAPSINGSRMVSGSLESSNVNLANEFSDLIGLQRGLQASAQTVSRSDEILQTIINL